jgi:toxin ParE1/3/4
MAQKPKAYNLYPRAKSDLIGIYDYTVEHWSQRQAEIYVRQLTDAFGALAAGRRLGRDAELGHDILKLPAGSHVIFYKVRETSIDIVRVLHEAMDVERNLKR